MKRRTAFLMVLCLCACLIGGCAGNAAQTNEATTFETETSVTYDAEETKEVESAEPVETEEAEIAETTEPVELIVFAAASMTETMEEIANPLNMCVNNSGWN